MPARVGGNGWGLKQCLSPAADRCYGNYEDQYGMGMAADAAGSVVLSASFLGEVDLGQGALKSAGQRDVLLAKLDPSGEAVFAQRFGDADEQYAGGVAVDAAGNIVLASESSSSMDFGGGPLTSAGKEDIFLARFDPQGAHLWSKRFGDAQAQGPRAVAVDSAGDVYLAASFQGAVDAGGGPLASAGINDVLLVKLAATGDHLFSARYGDADDQLPRGIAVDAAGHVALCGELAGSMDLGGGPLTSAGAKDLFIARFVPAP